MVVFCNQNGFFMASVTIKNVPDSLVTVLKSRAKRNGRSLNNEIIIGLQRYLSMRDQDAEEFLDKARTARKMAKGALTLEEVREAIESGRS